VVEVLASEILEICEGVEVEDSIEVFGPQIELDLGQGSSIHDVEPPVEVTGVVPTEVVEEEEESSVEVIEERTGAEPVPEDVREETGAIPVWEAGEGDFHFEDYPGDDFEKVWEFTPEETS